MSWLSKLGQLFTSPPSNVAGEITPLSTTSAIAKDTDLPFGERSLTAMNGSEFGVSIGSSTASTTRDKLFQTQIQSDNVPGKTRETTTVSIESGSNLLTYQVSKDYLAVGSNDDYLRVSLMAKTARAIADSLGCMLPTKKMVDDIWRSSDLKIAPYPMGASPDMISTNTLIRHNRAIQGQIAGKEFALVAGIKKDTVICKHLLQDKSRVCIYGWHYLTGVAIQGQNSTSHDVSYTDYSQAIRLVSRAATLNGQEVDLYDVLNDTKLCYLISEEGAYDGRGIYL